MVVVVKSKLTLTVDIREEAVQPADKTEPNTGQSPVPHAVTFTLFNLFPDVTAVHFPCNQITAAIFASRDKFPARIRQVFHDVSAKRKKDTQ